jgi:hypothetical protein
MKLAAPAGAVLLALACSTGCDRVLIPAAHPVYAAWEEGLTLGFEDPSLPSGPRFQKRQQVRVKTSSPIGSALAVTKTFTSLSGQWDGQVLAKDGGVMLQSEHSAGTLLLPEGFPDRVSRWEARGSFNWVVGRACVTLPGVRLADPGGTVGVWVESLALDTGARTRTLYLPDIGEAETLVWNQGRWVATNILVTRGFTDVPGPAAGTTSGSSS